MAHQGKKKIAILVVGMHRSGTSALSRVLSLVGCELPKNLMTGEKPNKSNARGFWESQPISDLNDEILWSMGSDWADWRPFDSGWQASPPMDPLRERAQALLHQEFGDSRLFVLKDPRVCRLLPFWIEALETFGAEPRAVLIIRNPADVAASLKQRDGMGVSCGHLIWLRYVLEAESGSRNLRRACLRYETLLSEPHAVTDRLARDLDVAWPKRASVRAHMEIDRFLLPDLRHHQSDDAALLANPVLSRWFGQSFELFNRWSGGEAHETDVALLDRIRSAFDEATPLFSRHIAESEQAIEGLNEALAERDGRIEGLNEALAERDGRIEGLNEALAERDGRIEGLNEALAERDGRIDGLNEALADQNGRMEELIGVIGHRDHVIEALYGSMSWRITAPVRRLQRTGQLLFTMGRARSSRIARTVYRRAPLPFSLKARIKEDLFRSIPFLFKHTVAYRNWLAFKSAQRRHPELQLTRLTTEQTKPSLGRDALGASNKNDRNRGIAGRVDAINSTFTKTGNVCIVLHLDCEDVAKRIVSEYLEPVCDDIDVFVTTPETISLKALDYLKEHLPHLYVMPSENRGRDIRPFLEILPVLIDNGYEIACKIHTKIFEHRLDGGDLFCRSMDCLLNPPKGIAEIIRMFSRNERLGLIAPSHSLMPLANPMFYEHNVPWLDRLLTRMGEADRVGKYTFHFPAGSMYWFRIRALAKLADREFIDVDEFEPETDQLDGALQHSVERIISLLVEQSGFDTTIISHPSSLSGRSATIVAGSNLPVEDFVNPSHLERIQPFAMQGKLTKGWYGGRELRPEETTSAGALPPRAISRLGEKAYKAGTRLIASRYLSSDKGQKDDEYDGLSLARRYGPIDEIRMFLGSREPSGSVLEMADCGGFTIVTPFYRHLAFFSKTALSVSRLALEESKAGSTMEWVIVNDDPTVSDEDLARRIPERLRPAVRLIRPDGEGGIVDALNSGIRRGRYRWTLFLDCDDEIEPNAISVLKHYIERFPRCRYVSSSLTDIDEQGNVLRFRGNELPIDRLFDVGMQAGHLKAVRSDLFDDVGHLDSYFESCQDYEFALRTAMQEPILKIPEPLYRYRWHGQTQSVSRSDHQKKVHQRIQRMYMRRFPTMQAGRDPATATTGRPRPSRSDMLHGAVIVRTQNRRPDLLAEAVHSVRVQPRLTPIVVMHGNEDDLQAVEDQLGDKDTTHFLLASERLKPGRRLGYPANVALDYVTGRPDRFDYVCFLDDDDILYPCFATRMSEALAWSGADLVYGMPNKRSPWRLAEAGHMPLPSSCLVVGNFITCNSYALAIEFLRHSSARFDEHLLYFDDWDFLLTLWGAGARFQFIAETVSEYRITSDGQLPGNERRYPKLSDDNFGRVQDKARKIAHETEDGLARFQREVLDFDWSEARHPQHIEQMLHDAHEIWVQAKRYREERFGGGSR